MTRKRQPRWTPDAFLAWFPVVMRYGALVGVAHQTLWARFDRPTLLGLYGLMLGFSEVAEAVKGKRGELRGHADPEERWSHLP